MTTKRKTPIRSIPMSDELWAEVLARADEEGEKSGALLVRRAVRFYLEEKRKRP